MFAGEKQECLSNKSISLQKDFLKFSYISISNTKTILL
jgi:hypothetical protein